MTSNKQIVLRERPKTFIDTSLQNGTFEEKKGEVATEAKEGHVLVKSQLLSIDPAMRGWLRDARSYLPPVQIGEVMRSYGLGEVIASQSTSFAKGDLVYGPLNWQEYAQVPEKALQKITKIEGVALEDHLGVLGLTGLTAYFGVTKILEPKEGEVVVVTGAAGATGSVVVQICKLKGCKVIATAGSDEKCAWLKEKLGADEALNYKAPDFTANFRKTLKDKYGFAHCLFENVGGEQLDLTLGCMRPFGRIAFCGSISQYNAEQAYGLRAYTNIVTMRLKLQGFIVMDFNSEWPAAAQQLAEWVKAGKIVGSSHVMEGGLAVAPQALSALFEGKNQGKMLVKL